MAAAIHRHPSWVMKFFGIELGVKSSYEEKEGEGVRALLNGWHNTPDLQVKAKPKL